jgi:hypothetical protein
VHLTSSPIGADNAIEGSVVLKQVTPRLINVTFGLLPNISELEAATRSASRQLL